MEVKSMTHHDFHIGSNTKYGTFCMKLTFSEIA